MEPMTNPNTMTALQIEDSYVDALEAADRLLGINHPITMWADLFADTLVDLLYGAGTVAYMDHEADMAMAIRKGELTL